MRNLFAGLAVVLCGASAADAEIITSITATITADNHYAFYAGSGDGTVVDYIGGNEIGAAGSPGTYNWSIAETYNVYSTNELVYIAAWSDDRVAQGLLAELVINGVELLSGDASWQVFATGIDKDDGDPAPTVAELATQIVIANDNGAWDTVAVGGHNGVAPWGPIADISTSARWMWVHDRVGNASSFAPGADHDEYLVFRAPVPEPASMVLLISGLVATLGFGRRSLAR